MNLTFNQFNIHANTAFFIQHCALTFVNVFKLIFV